MNTLHPKVIELLQVSPSKKLGYLKIRVLSRTGKNTVYWKVDQQTARNIQKIVQPIKHGKIRLSQNTFINAQTNTFTSSLSWTVGNKSKSYTFTCSKQYATQLNQLLPIKNIEHIKALNFISEEKFVLSSYRNRWVKLFDFTGLRLNFKPSKRFFVGMSSVAILLFALLTIMFTTKGNFTAGQAGKLNANKNYASTVNYIPQSKKYLSEGTPKQTGLNEAEDSQEPQVEKKNKQSIPKEADESDQSAHDGEQSYEISQTINKQTLPTIADNQREVSRYQGSQREEQTANIENNQIHNLPANYVALTFDDGPSKYTKEIADILLDYEVGGTFFFVGDRVKYYEDAVKYVADKGLAVGSHSMSHDNVPKLEQSKQKSDFINATAAIEGATGEKLSLYRPPYGEINDYMADLLQAHGQTVVLWNLDTEDWKHHNSKEILNRIVDKDPAGSIILMHENEAVVSALPSIIEYLQQQGLEIVNIK